VLWLYFTGDNVKPHSSSAQDIFASVIEQSANEKSMLTFHTYNFRASRSAFILSSYLEAYDLAYQRTLYHIKHFLQSFNVSISSVNDKLAG